MLTIKEPRVMWAWVCPVTGMVLDEGWGSTEAYARSQTERKWGKRRMAQGDMCAVRVTIELLTPEQAQAERAAFAEWKATRAMNGANPVRPKQDQKAVSGTFGGE